MHSERIAADDPVRQLRYGTPVLCTVRGSLTERALLKKAAHRAECSLNVYIRRRLGLSDQPAPEGESTGTN